MNLENEVKFILLNTSLNISKPIINNEFRFNNFKKTNLDAIIIGNYIVEKKIKTSFK